MQPEAVSRSASASSSDGGGFLGSTMSWQYYAYGGAYEGVQSSGEFTDNGGVGGTFIDGAGTTYFNIIADDSSVTFNYSVEDYPPGDWSPSGLSLPPTIYSGIAVNIVSGPPLTSVTIDPSTNMAGFDASRLSFTPTQIQVDWQNLSFDTSTIVKLDLNDTLTLTGLGLGTGTVTDNYIPQEIDCTITAGILSGTCTASYPYDTVVTLTAAPADDGMSTFGGWGGACASFGTTLSCSVTMSSAQNVSASFNAPGPTQAGTVTTTAPTAFSYEGGYTPGSGGSSYTGGFDFTTQLTGSGESPLMVQVTAEPFPGSGTTSQSACSQLLLTLFPSSSSNPPQCFVHQNGAGVRDDASLGFAVTCPGSPTNGTCGLSASPTFYAALGSDFYLNPTNDNPGLSWGNNTLYYEGGNPYVGVVQFAGTGTDPCGLTNPLAENPSNQVISLSFTDGNPTPNPVKGGSQGTASCWLFVYNMLSEAPSVTIAQPMNGNTYTYGESTAASYTCYTDYNGNPTPAPPVGPPYPAYTYPGPYLTATSCTATDSPGGPVGEGGQFDTLSLGSHSFAATVVDSATNTASATASYTVVQASTTTTVTSNTGANPSVSPNAVIFTANVAVVAPGGGTPTGSVTWSGNTGCGMIAVTATCTSALAPGINSVTATYLGDTGHTGSTGALSQTVDQVPAITSANSAAFTLGVYNSFTVTTTGYPTPTTIVEAGTLPGGVSFMNNSNGTGTLSGTPTVGGTYPITFTPSNGVGSPVAQTFTLTTSGPLVSVSPTSINFGNAYLFNVNAAIVTVKNIGTSTVNISNVSLTLSSGTNGGDFSFLNFCPSTLAAGKSCYISVLFFAGNVGTLSAILNVADNAPGSPQQVSLSATVINPRASLSPTSLSFGTITHGTSSTQNVTLSNPGTTALTINSIGITGTNPTDFGESNTCPTSLAAGGNCTIAVTFKPSAAGTFSAKLTVNDNAASGTQNVSLSGKGK
jgi:hypothetical protein